MFPLPKGTPALEAREVRWAGFAVMTVLFVFVLRRGPIAPHPDPRLTKFRPATRSPR